DCALHSIETHHGFVADDVGGVANAARNGDPIAGAEDDAMAVDVEAELPGDYRVDLVDTVRVFGERRARWIDIAHHDVAERLEPRAHRRFGQLAVSRNIPVAHRSHYAPPPQIASSLASRPQAHR